MRSKTTDLTCVVSSTNPGFQLYSGNFLNTTGKCGSKYDKYSAISIEAHDYPDAVNQVL